MPADYDPSLIEVMGKLPAVEPTRTDLVMKTLSQIANQLDDIKLKLDIQNETSLELLEEAKRGPRSDFGGPARLIRNKPPTSFRRW